MERTPKWHKNNRIAHYAIGKNNPADSYYTKREVAKYCIDQWLRVCKREKINSKEYILIEPSAGEGCFYDQMPSSNKKIAIDISTSIVKSKIICADYLQWYPENVNQKYMVIGNPPFGHRGAMAFINRSFLFADLVAETFA